MGGRRYQASGEGAMIDKGWVLVYNTGMSQMNAFFYSGSYIRCSVMCLSVTRKTPEAGQRMYALIRDGHA